MYPALPYPGYSWPLSHHTGVADSRSLYQILWAAANFAVVDDPELRINEYLTANGILTSNVRSDSGQPDAWRDYQQMLSELGLIYSTKVLKHITLTPLGLAFLDRSLSFTDMITLQALRLQYPNGHHVGISVSLRRLLDGTPFITIRTLAELQQLTGVQLRPCVLIWRVLRSLQEEGEPAYLTLDEIQRYIMRCSSHSDTEACVNHITRARRKEAFSGSASNGRGRRNAQDWVRLLLRTPLFEGTIGRDAVLRMSERGLSEAAAIDEICSALERPDSFWTPGRLDIHDRLSWYASFGSMDLGVPFIPEEIAKQTAHDRAEELVEEDAEDSRRIYRPSNSISLHEFDPAALGYLGSRSSLMSVATIDSSYDASKAREARALHDRMVVLIGNTCRQKTSAVWNDPQSVDLLVEFRGTEFIIEVKSVTPRNLIHKIRYAIGQLSQYDYLRSTQSSLPRRKAIALTARVPKDAWYVGFLNNHMDFDLLSLDGRVLRVNSHSPITADLFGMGRT